MVVKLYKKGKDLSDAEEIYVRSMNKECEIRVVAIAV